jgi:hypothetical protein
LPTNTGTEDAKAAADTAPKLTPAQQADVVRRLAAYDTPELIAKSMKQDLGIEITRQSIAFYDPTRNSRCPRRWSKLFWTAREDFLQRTADVGAAHGVVRVRRLDQMACDQMDKGNTAEARALLKQAADEMSRMAGQKEEGSHEGDRKLRELSNLSEDELDERRAAVAARLRVERPGGRASGDRDGTAEEAQPPGESLPG